MARRFITFALDTGGGQDVLTGLAMKTIKQSGEAVKARASAMASSMSSNPPQISISTSVGTIRRGRRAIATIRADGGADAHKNYIGAMALAKSKDAGRV